MSDHVSAGDGGEVDPRHTAGPTAISAQASASSGADAVTPPTVDRANPARARDLKDPQPHLVVMFSVVIGTAMIAAGIVYKLWKRRGRPMAARDPRIVEGEFRVVDAARIERGDTTRPL